MPHYRITHSGRDGVSAPLLDAICPDDRIACRLAARLFRTADSIEVQRANGHVVAQMTADAALAEIKAPRASRRAGRHGKAVAATPSGGRQDLRAPAELSA